MANMGVTDRNQFDRVDLHSSGEGIRRGAERGTSIYLAFTAVLGALLSFAALTVVNGWASWVVLGAIVTATVGLMIAVSPLRRG